MPAAGSLTELKGVLAEALAPSGAFQSAVWGDPAPMERQARLMRKAFHTDLSAPPRESLIDAIKAFFLSKEQAGFTSIKYACHGLSLPLDAKGDRIIDDATLFIRVLKAAHDQQSTPRLFRRCYLGLLQSYFAYQEAESLATRALGVKNFRVLREYLNRNLQLIADAALSRVRPAWVERLEQHRNLLTDKPCDRYVASISLGETAEFSTVCAALGISRESWLWQEIILAFLREVCARPDAEFIGSIDAALDIADGKAELSPNAATARAIVAALVRRYESVANRRENVRLRDAALEHIGNPWLKKPAWDVWVADEPARRMVESWLKARLIRDFFELLSDHGAGATDQRRLDYWLRFEPVMTDIRFALGSFALRNQSEEFKELRKRMAGSRATLDPSQGEMNNAFLMKIGKYVFIEFGVKGNACYFYREDKLPVDFNANRISIHQLRRDRKQQRSHVPSATWEQGFDAEFCPLVDYWPELTRAKKRGGSISPELRHIKATIINKDPILQEFTTSFRSPVLTLEDLLDSCWQSGFDVEDRRPKGGALWVRTDDAEASGLKDDLTRIGFKYKYGHGYWLL